MKQQKYNTDIEISLSRKNLSKPWDKLLYRTAIYLGLSSICCVLWSTYATKKVTIMSMAKNMSITVSAMNSAPGFSSSMNPSSNGLIHAQYTTKMIKNVLQHLNPEKHTFSFNYVYIYENIIWSTWYYNCSTSPVNGIIWGDDIFSQVHLNVLCPQMGQWNFGKLLSV